MRYNILTTALFFPLIAHSFYLHYFPKETFSKVNISKKPYSCLKLVEKDTTDVYAEISTDVFGSEFRIPKSSVTLTDDEYYVKNGKKYKKISPEKRQKVLKGFFLLHLLFLKEIVTIFLYICIGYNDLRVAAMSIHNTISRYIKYIQYNIRIMLNIIEINPM